MLITAFDLLFGFGGITLFVLVLRHRSKHCPHQELPELQTDERLGQLADSDDEEADRAHLNMLAQEITARHVVLDPVTGVVSLVTEESFDADDT